MPATERGVGHESAPGKQLWTGIGFVAADAHPDRGERHEPPGRVAGAAGPGVLVSATTAQPGTWTATAGRGDETVVVVGAAP